MRRAVLDSSVLISAFLTPHGTSGQVLTAAERREFVLCLSQEIISETRRSLTTKARRIRRYYDYPDGRIEDYAGSLAVLAEMVSNLPEIRVVALDPKDDVIVATAFKAKADYLVSGDRHLLALGSHGRIRMDHAAPIPRSALTRAQGRGRTDGRGVNRILTMAR